jgi:dihydrofolate reductase
MRKLSVSTLLTLDGVLQDPGGFGETENGGWAGPYFDEEAGRIAYEHLLAADMFLAGRVTYELFKEHWTSVHDNEYAARLNDMPTLVASTTLTEPLEWNATLIQGDVPTEIARLKEQDGGDIIMYGSATLLRTLMEHDLVDELSVWVHPVVLGSGKRLFADGMDRVHLELVDSTTLGTGVVIMTYRPAR